MSSENEVNDEMDIVDVITSNEDKPNDSDSVTENSEVLEVLRESETLNEKAANEASSAALNFIDPDDIENSENQGTESSLLTNEKKSEHSDPKKHPTKLPLTRIKNIMKMDPDVSIVSNDAVFLVTKATEMFIEFLARETNKQTTSGKRKTVMRKDVDSVIDSVPHLCFLDGVFE